MKKYSLIIIVFVNVFLYLSGVFIYADFNTANWPLDFKSLLAMLSWLITTFAFLSFLEK